MALIVDRPILGDWSYIHFAAGRFGRTRVEKTDPPPGRAFIRVFYPSRVDLASAHGLGPLLAETGACSPPCPCGHSAHAFSYARQQSRPSALSSCASGAQALGDRYVSW